jgi:hypothetical protein
MVCSRHHIHCSCGGDKASRKWLFCADFKAAASGAAGRAAAQARAVLGNSGGRIAVAADYLPGGELTASRRQSGRAGLNAASGRNVGQVCANGGATKLHRWFSWAALTKCRCSEIVLGDPNTRYGKLLTRLTGLKKTREMVIIRASWEWRDPAATSEVLSRGCRRRLDLRLERRKAHEMRHRKKSRTMASAGKRDTRCWRQGTIPRSSPPY